MNKILKNQQGFTLMEVMIAITILSFIMIAVVSTTDSSQQVKDRVLTEDRERLQVETALSRFEWDFSQIYSPLYFTHEMRKTNFDSQETLQVVDNILAYYQTKSFFNKVSYENIPIPKVFTEDKSTFGFFTASNRRKFKNIKQSHFAWVQYQLEKNEEDSARAKNILVRKYISNDVWNDEELNFDDTKSQVLLRNIESLKFEFWDKEKKKWVDNIRTITNGEHKVWGVKMSIEWIDPTNVKVLFVRIFRTLFPYFEPEDMYKLKQENPNSIGNRNQFGSNNNEEDDKDDEE